MRRRRDGLPAEPGRRPRDRDGPRARAWVGAPGPRTRCRHGARHADPGHHLPHAHQGFEFDYRLRKAGLRLLFDPAMVIRWHCRQSIADLYRQYYRYGRGKVDVVRLHPESLHLRHVAPPSFVAYVLVSLVRSARHPGRWLAMIAPYASALVVESLRSGRQLGSAGDQLRLPAAYVAMEVGWGVGFWSGVRTALLRRTGSATFPR